METSRPSPPPAAPVPPPVQVVSAPAARRRSRARRSRTPRRRRAGGRRAAPAAGHRALLAVTAATLIGAADAVTISLDALADPIAPAGPGGAALAADAPAIALGLSGLDAQADLGHRPGRAGRRRPADAPGAARAERRQPHRHRRLTSHRRSRARRRRPRRGPDEPPEQATDPESGAADLDPRRRSDPADARGPPLRRLSLNRPLHPSTSAGTEPQPTLLSSGLRRPASASGTNGGISSGTATRGAKASAAGAPAAAVTAADPGPPGDPQLADAPPGTAAPSASAPAGSRRRHDRRRDRRPPHPVRRGDARSTPAPALPAATPRRARARARAAARRRHAQQRRRRVRRRRARPARRDRGRGRPADRRLRDAAPTLEATSADRLSERSRAGSWSARGPPAGSVLITAALGGVLSAGDATLTFAPGALPADAYVSITPVAGVVRPQRLRRGHRRADHHLR